MKLNNFYFSSLALLGACGSSIGASSGAGNKSSTQTSTATNPSVLPALSGDNVMPVSVNGSQCSANSYPNKPCVSVTVCTPGTTTCQTISDILLDTGSYGLRLFASAVTVPLTQQLSGSRLVAQCVQFGDGSSDWGPVKTADVVLGNEPAVSVPIQIIDSTFAQSAVYCSGAETGPSQAGFKGILGVGMFAQDCGAKCANRANNGLYYSCTGSGGTDTCAGAQVAIANQVKNPVAALASDNNGLLLRMPSVAVGGTGSVDGYLVLGINTRANNKPSNEIVYTAGDSTGTMTTSFNGKSYDAFLDSGSNALYFGSYAGAPDCKLTDPDFENWYCPGSTLSLSATNSGGAGSGSVAFTIGNFIGLWNSTNNVFGEMAGIGEADTFDWGLPFYFGRNVYQGIEGAASSLGTGTYWAY